MILGGGLAATPALAATPDTICSNAPAASAPLLSDDSLAKASALAEAALARDDIEAARDAIATTESGNAAPNPASIALYCMSVGEVFRVAPFGSQIQAQRYLRHALNAGGTGRSPVAAKTAYRLGLAYLTAASGEVRGLRGRGVRGSEPAAYTGLSKVRSALRGATAAEGGASVAGCGGSEGDNVYSAWVMLDCAQRLAMESGDPALATRASVRLARMALSLSQNEGADANRLRGNARKAVGSGLKAAQAIASPAERAALAGRLGEMIIEIGDAGDPALSTAMAVMRASAPDDPGTSAFILALEGRRALALGQPDVAATALRKAIFLEGQRPRPLRLADWYVLLAQADPANRAAHARSAYRALEAVRALLPRFDPVTEESTFDLRMRAVFELAADTALTPSAGEDDQASIAAVQGIVETFRQAELQSTFGNECVPARDPIKPGELKAGEIILYPLLLPDRVELLYADGSDAAKGGVRYRRLTTIRNADRASVSGLAEQLVEAIGYTGEEWKQPARQLYDILIAPIADRLGGDVATLVIVPDSAMRNLPFASLLAQDGRFLIEQTKLVVVPSLAYSQPGKAQKAAPVVIAASLEKEVALPQGNFSKLDGTGREARMAVGLDDPKAPAGQLLTDFTRAELVDAMNRQQPDVLHLATHASFNGRSDRAFIVANGETIPISDLRALIARNRARGEELALLVLSACETAVGDSELSMGLAGAAVQSGAASALASLWQVDDASTVALMTGFYARYRAGAPKAEALRLAQLDLIKSGGDTAAPFNWAAFILLGSWR